MSDNFVFCHVKDKKLARRLGFKDFPVVAVVDSDGAKYAEAKTDSPEHVREAMNAALEMWSDREIVWSQSYSGGVAAAKERERLMLLAFTDNDKPSKEALKALESKVVAKYHNSLQFVEQALDSDIAKKFGVTAAPTFVLVHPEKIEAGKEYGKVTGTRLEELKPVIKAALQKFNAEKEESK